MQGLKYELIAGWCTLWCTVDAQNTTLASQTETHYITNRVAEGREGWNIVLGRCSTSVVIERLKVLDNTTNNPFE